MEGSDNGAVKSIGRCMGCMLACLESCIDYFDKAAFSYIAISGQSFCDGCYNGMILTLKHGLEFTWAMTLAQGFVWLGKLGVVAANVFVSFCVMKYYTNDVQGDAGNVLTPLIFVGVVTYLTADMFLSQFDEAVQALLTCICVDKDLNGGLAKSGPPTFHDKVGRVHDEQVAKRAKGGYASLNDMH